MEKELEDFIASQMHNIKVRYHIVGKQEELQEIYDLYSLKGRLMLPMMLMKTSWM